MYYILLGILYLPLSGFSCQCWLLLLFDPKQLLGVGMHYLNDPLCFSQSGGCRRLINLTCLLFRTQWGQTHIAYSKPALRHPPFSPMPCSFCSLNQNIRTFHQPSDYHTNRWDCDICKWTKYGVMIYLHTEWGLCLTVIRFTTAYICTIVDGHEDVRMIFLSDLHALLIFLRGHPVLTLIRRCSWMHYVWVLNWCQWRI